jgi:hypothetical protein
MRGRLGWLFSLLGIVCVVTILALMWCRADGAIGEQVLRQIRESEEPDSNHSSPHPLTVQACEPVQKADSGSRTDWLPLTINQTTVYVPRDVRHVDVNTGEVDMLDVATGERGVPDPYVSLRLAGDGYDVSRVFRRRPNCLGPMFGTSDILAQRLQAMMEKAGVPTEEARAALQEASKRFSAMSEEAILMAVLGSSEEAVRGASSARQVAEAAMPLLARYMHAFGGGEVVYCVKREESKENIYLIPSGQSGDPRVQAVLLWAYDEAGQHVWEGGLSMTKGQYTAVQTAEFVGRLFGQPCMCNRP